MLLKNFYYYDLYDLIRIDLYDLTRIDWNDLHDLHDVYDLYDLYNLYDLFETNNVSWFYKGFKILFGVKVNLCSNSAQLLAAGFLWQRYF